MELNEKTVKSMKKILYPSILIVMCFFFFSHAAFAQGAGSEERLTLKNKDCSISIFPNPTSSRLYIDLGQGSQQEPSVMLFDMLGNKLEGLSAERKDAQTWQVDVSGFTPGFYFIKVRTAEESLSRRITVNP